MVDRNETRDPEAMSIWEIYGERSARTTLFFTDVAPTDPAEKFRSAQAATSGVATIFGVLWFIYIIWTRKEIQKRKIASQQRILNFVVIHMMCMTIGNLTIFVFAVSNLDPSLWWICAYIGSLPSFTYVMGNGFSYAIFLRRASITGHGENSRACVNTLWKLAMIVTYSIPMFLLIVALFVHGKVFFGEICVQDHPWWVAAMFNVIDTSLSTMFLFLFLDPVLRQIREVKGHQILSVNAKRMQNIARRNLKWTSLTIFSTIIFLCTITVISTSPRSIAKAHTYQLTWILQPVDSLCNMVGTLAISTVAWLGSPRKNVSKIRSADAGKSDHLKTTSDTKPSTLHTAASTDSQ